MHPVQNFDLKKKKFIHVKIKLSNTIFDFKILILNGH